MTIEVLKKEDKVCGECKLVATCPYADAFNELMEEICDDWRFYVVPQKFLASNCKYFKRRRSGRLKQNGEK